MIDLSPAQATNLLYQIDANGVPFEDEAEVLRQLLEAARSFDGAMLSPDVREWLRESIEIEVVKAREEPAAHLEFAP